jgi:hypothetical protein
VQALVFLPANRAAFEVSAQARNACAGIGAANLELDVLGWRTPGHDETLLQHLVDLFAFSRLFRTSRAERGSVVLQPTGGVERYCYRVLIDHVWRRGGRATLTTV